MFMEWVVDAICISFLLGLAWLILIGQIVDNLVRKIMTRKMPWHIQGLNKKWRKYLKEQGNPWLNRRD